MLRDPRMLGAVMALSTGAAGARAEEQPLLSATLQCEQRSQRGRVVCEAEVEVSASTSSASGGGAPPRIVWADVVVRAVPDFAKPLRSRVGPSEATARTDDRVRLPIALIASRQGEGRLEVTVRGVVCSADRARCRPIQAAAETVLRVGPLR